MRSTRQREEVYQALLDRPDHPTATEVFLRVKRRVPSISLATVYNCLETLTQSGLLRHVATERGASRYCPNLQPHAHFFCQSCAAVFDVPLAARDLAPEGWDLPPASRLESVDVTLHGLCPGCATRRATRENHDRTP